MLRSWLAHTSSSFRSPFLLFVGVSLYRPSVHLARLHATVREPTSIPISQLRIYKSYIGASQSRLSRSDRTEIRSRVQDKINSLPACCCHGGCNVSSCTACYYLLPLSVLLARTLCPSHSPLALAETCKVCGILGGRSSVQLFLLLFFSFFHSTLLLQTFCGIRAKIQKQSCLSGHLGGEIFFSSSLTFISYFIFCIVSSNL